MLRMFTDAEQELCTVFMVLKSYKDLQKLGGSRLVALRCDMHLGAGKAPLCRDGMEPFVSSLSSALISAAGREGREGAFACKRQDKNCRSERKNRGKETRWVVDRIIPVLAKGKRVFLLPIRAHIFYKFLEMLSYE